VTRYGRADTSFAFENRRAGTPTDLERGTRRARAAALLSMALPGSMYVYQGEELGLPEVEDIPAERRHDPMWFRSGGVDPGRDGCRVPLPWAGDQPTSGLGKRRLEPWGEADTLQWLPASDGVLAFQRGDQFACLVNFGPDPVELPAGAEILISSNKIQGGVVPQDTTVWLRETEQQPPKPPPNAPQNPIGQGKEGR
jgi:alpha-glucosidase